MTTFPGSPRLTKGGIVLIDPLTSMVKRIIVLQYNPDTISRTLQAQSAGSETQDRTQVLRLRGAPIETIKIDAEIDAADQLEFPQQNERVVENGIHPELAALELMIYPTSQQVEANLQLAQSGRLEIAPMESPLTVFVWSQQRVIPIRLTDFSVVEEAFAPDLNPLRAKVSLGMRVLTVNDLGFNHRGSSLFMAYHKNKERLRNLLPNGDFGSLGIQRI